MMSFVKMCMPSLLWFNAIPLTDVPNAPFRAPIPMDLWYIKKIFFLQEGPRSDQPASSSVQVEEAAGLIDSFDEESKSGSLLCIQGLCDCLTTFDV